MPQLADLTLPLRTLMTVLAMRAGLRRDMNGRALMTQVAGLALTSSLGESLSSAQIRRLARRCAESRALHKLDDHDIARGARAHRVINEASLDELRARKVGAVVASIHLGPYLYVASELVARSFDVVAIALDEVMERLNGLVASFPRHPGRMELMPVRGSHSLLGALRALRKGAIAVVYIDGAGGVRGPGPHDTHQIEFKIGSMPVRLPTGAAFLSQRAGVPALLGVAWRDALGRRVVEYSDPLPAPARDDPDGAVNMVKEMAAWFERRIFAHPEQWIGWLLPVVTWAGTGAAPTATRENLEQTRARVHALLTDPRRSARLSADPVRVGAIEHGEDRVLVDGARRMILEATPLGVRIMRAAQRRTRLADLPRHAPGDRAALEFEVTRMVLAGLATIEEPDRA